jgi:hypothetical protein
MMLEYAFDFGADLHGLHGIAQQVAHHVHTARLG